MRSGTFLAPLVLLLLTPPATPDNKKPTQLARLDTLVHQLGDSAYQKREAAERALVALGDATLPALRKAAGSDDAEVRRRAARVATTVRRRALARETAKFAGHWVAVAQREDGKDVETSKVRGMTIHFQAGGEATLVEIRSGVPTQSIAATWAVQDASGPTPRVDIHANGSRCFRAIYRFEKEQLTLCGKQGEEADRPADLTTKPGDDRYLFTLKRANAPTASPEPPKRPIPVAPAARSY